MSTESRLARLGLLHLKDKPEELYRRLEEMVKEDEAELERNRALPSEPPAEQSQEESK